MTIATAAMMTQQLHASPSPFISSSSFHPAHRPTTTDGGGSGRRRLGHDSDEVEPPPPPPPPPLSAPPDEDDDGESNDFVSRCTATMTYKSNENKITTFTKTKRRPPRTTPKKWSRDRKSAQEQHSRRRRRSSSLGRTTASASSVSSGSAGASSSSSWVMDRARRHKPATSGGMSKNKQHKQQPPYQSRSGSRLSRRLPSSRQFHDDGSSVSSRSVAPTPSNVVAQPILMRDLSDLSGSDVHGLNMSSASNASRSHSPASGVGGGVVLSLGNDRPWQQANVLSALNERQPLHPQPPLAEQGDIDEHHRNAMMLRKELVFMGPDDNGVEVVEPSVSLHTARRNTNHTTNNSSAAVSVASSTPSHTSGSKSGASHTHRRNGSTVGGISVGSSLMEYADANPRTPLIIVLIDPTRKVYEMMQLWVDVQQDTVRDILHAVQKQITTAPSWKQDYDGLFQVRNHQFHQLIHILNVSKYDVQPHEVWLAKPWSMSAKAAVQHGSQVLNHLQAIGVLYSTTAALAAAGLTTSRNNNSSQLQSGSNNSHANHRMNWNFTSSLIGASNNSSNSSNPIKSSTSSSSTSPDDAILFLTPTAKVRIYVPDGILKHYHACQFLTFSPPLETPPVVRVDVLGGDGDDTTSGSQLSESQIDGISVEGGLEDDHEDHEDFYPSHHAKNSGSQTLSSSMASSAPSHAEGSSSTRTAHNRSIEYSYTSTGTHVSKAAKAAAQAIKIRLRDGQNLDESLLQSSPMTTTTKTTAQSGSPVVVPTKNSNNGKKPNQLPHLQRRLSSGSNEPLLMLGCDPWPSPPLAYLMDDDDINNIDRSRLDSRRYTATVVSLNCGFCRRRRGRNLEHIHQQQHRPLQQQRSGRRFGSRYGRLFGGGGGGSSVASGGSDYPVYGGLVGHHYKTDGTGAFDVTALGSTTLDSSETVAESGVWKLWEEEVQSKASESVASESAPLLVVRRDHAH